MQIQKGTNIGDGHSKVELLLTLWSFPHADMHLRLTLPELIKGLVPVARHKNHLGMALFRPLFP